MTTPSLFAFNPLIKPTKTPTRVSHLIGKMWMLLSVYASSRVSASDSTIPDCNALFTEHLGAQSQVFYRRTTNNVIKLQHYQHPAEISVSIAPTDVNDLIAIENTHCFTSDQYDNYLGDIENVIQPYGFAPIPDNFSANYEFSNTYYYLAVSKIPHSYCQASKLNKLKLYYAQLQTTQPQPILDNQLTNLTNGYREDIDRCLTEKQKADETVGIIVGAGIGLAVVTTVAGLTYLYRKMNKINDAQKQPLLGSSPSTISSGYGADGEYKSDGDIDVNRDTSSENSF